MIWKNIIFQNIPECVRGLICPSLTSLVRKQANGKIGFVNHSNLKILIMFICSIMGLCNSCGMRATVIRFQILTSLLFFGMFFMLRIRTAKHSLVLSYLFKETQIFNPRDWPDIGPPKKSPHRRDSTSTHFLIPQVKLHSSKMIFW